MTKEVEPMARPVYENKWNLNTILLGLAIIIPSVGWGISWKGVTSVQDQNVAAISELRMTVNNLREDNRKMDGLNYRVTAVETANTALSVNQQDQGKTLNELSADMRVVREIVERLDKKKLP